MAKRVAFICQGKSKNFTDDTLNDLHSLDANIEKVVTALRKYGDWEIPDENIFIVKDSATISAKIEALEDDRDTEVLLFYTGHGYKVKDDSYVIVGEDEEAIEFSNVTKSMRITKQNINYAIIIDACYSGEVLKDFKPQVNIEFISSTGLAQAYEREFGDKIVSNFSYYFYEILKDNESENLTLSDIRDQFSEKKTGQNSHHQNATNDYSKQIIISYPSQQSKLKDLKQNLKRKYSFVGAHTIWPPPRI